MTIYLVRSNSKTSYFKGIRRLSDGTLLCMVQDRTNYYGYLMASFDSGKTWQEVANTGEIIGEVFSFDADPSGNGYVVYTTAAGDPVYFYKFTRSGNTWTKGERETVANADSTFPSKRGGIVDILALPNGMVFVSYQNYYDAIAVIRRRNADGTWEDPKLIVDLGSNIDTVPQVIGYLAPDGTNRIVVSVRTGDGACTPYYSTDFGNTFSSVGDLGVEPSHVSMSSMFKEVFAYASDGNIYIKVKDSPYITYTVDSSGACSNPRVSMYGNTIRVVYTYKGINSAGDIAVKISNDLGQTFGDRILITTDPNTDDYACVDYHSPGVYIIFNRDSDVYFSTIAKEIIGYRTEGRDFIEEKFKPVI
jgi:hypothetical protein